MKLAGITRAILTALSELVGEGVVEGVRLGDGVPSLNKPSTKLSLSLVGVFVGDTWIAVPPTTSVVPAGIEESILSDGSLPYNGLLNMR